MSKVAKAIIAAVTGGSGALVTALSDGSVTAIEYVLVVSTIIVAGMGVWATTNAKETA